MKEHLIDEPRIMKAEPGGNEQVARWVASARAGSEPAFAGLVDHFTPRLFGFLRGQGLQLQDAEDLVQETFIRAHANLHRYDASWSFATWLFTICRRLLISWYRRRKPAPAVDAPLEEPVAEQPDPDQGLIDRELWQQARVHLKAVQYEALWLHYHEGLSTAEVARVMGRTGLSVRVTLHRARARLRGVLAEGEPVPAGPVLTGS